MAAQDPGFLQKLLAILGGPMQKPLEAAAKQGAAPQTPMMPAMPMQNYVQDQIKRSNPPVIPSLEGLGVKTPASKRRARKK